MRPIHAPAVATALLFATPSLSFPDQPKPATAAAAWSPGSARQHLAVESMDLDLQDAKRNRAVPVRIWYPRDAKGPFPIVVFSHGLGGTRTGYEYFGRFLAENGIVSIHPQHVGSDESVWRGKTAPMRELQKAAKDLDEILARPRDISFVLDEAEKLNASDPVLKGKLDLEKVAVAGHSFGAYTALASSGRRLVGPRGIKVVDESDPRIKACIAMSAPGKEREAKNGTYDHFKIPCLHMTGTLDASPIGETTAADRRIPYDSIKAGNQYLITFTGGDHMIFSGRGRTKAREFMLKDTHGDAEHDAIFQEVIKDSSLAFLRAYLLGDDAAKSWLTNRGLGSELEGKGILEKK